MFPVITTNRKQSALSDFSRWLFTDSDHHTGNSKPELKSCYGARFHCDLRQLAAYGTVLLLICFTFQSHHICKASQPDDEATDSEMDRGCSTVFVLLHPTTKMNLWQQIAARFWSNSDKKTLFFTLFFSHNADNLSYQAVKPSYLTDADVAGSSHHYWSYRLASSVLSKNLFPRICSYFTELPLV